MCEFCEDHGIVESSARGEMMLREYPGGSYLQTKSWYEYYNEYDEPLEAFTGDNFDIYFCPICGREL